MLEKSLAKGIFDWLCWEGMVDVGRFERIEFEKEGAFSRKPSAGESLPSHFGFLGGMQRVWKDRLNTTYAWLCVGFRWFFGDVGWRVIGLGIASLNPYQISTLCYPLAKGK